MYLQTLYKYTAFYSLFILYYLVVQLQAKTNLCPTTTGCKCRLLRNVMRAECTGRNPDIRDLRQKNISTLILNKAHFSNATLLGSLRNISTLQDFKMRRTQPSYFDWNWLPDSCRKVTASGSVLNSVSDPLQFQSQNGSCLFRQSLNITRLFIYSISYQSMPSCLPTSLTLLSMVRVPLTEFGSNLSKTPTWPANLKSFHLKSVNFSVISSKVFKNSPATLKKILIFICLKPWFNFPTAWSNPSSIESITLQRCHINTSSSTDFENLHKLKYLDLTDNKFETIPAGLPVNLLSLTLNRNLIRSMGKNTLKNLTKLFRLLLRGNNIEYVSLDLPNTLEYLDLSKNKIQYIDNSMLRKLQRLKQLDLSHNRLINMPQNLTTGLKYLNVGFNLMSVIHSTADYNYCSNCTLYINRNNWVCNSKFVEMLFWSTQRKTKIFTDTRNKCDRTVLEKLDPHELTEIIKYLKYVKQKQFQKCVFKINTFVCVNASLTKLPKLLLLPILTKVKITHNPNLTAIPNDYALIQTKMTELNLEENSLNQFPIGLPSSLKIIILDGNQIKSISNEAQTTLSSLVQLETLSLGSNGITVIHNYQLKPLINLKNLDLFNNPLICDCSLYALVNWYINNTKLARRERHFFPTCASPVGQKGRSIARLLGYFTYSLQCVPPLCLEEKPYLDGILNCSKTIQKQQESQTLLNVKPDFTKQPNVLNNSYWHVLDFSNLELTQNDIQLEQMPLLQIINLAGNKLTSIPVKNLPRTLEILILTNNSITQIPTNISKSLSKLKLLDLRQNNIEVISKDVLPSLAEINTVLLQDNPFECDCNQKHFINFINVQVQHENTFNNSKLEKLTCYKPNHLEGFHVFNLTETDYCIETWPKIMGSIIGGISILFIIAIIASAVFIRKRKLQEKHDILEAFRQLLEKEAFASIENQAESNSHYQYDAFVSYSNNSCDEDFVYKMLEELEDQRGRKLCIHERDFVAGRGIADNIVNCITMSRRIILVLSKKYISSSWCQYEVQVALAQMHQHRRGKLLLPILLEDVVKNKIQEGSVKTILSLISGIHVPSANQTKQNWDSFWNSMEKAISEDNIVEPFQILEVD